MSQANPYTKNRWDRTPVKELKIGPFAGGINRYNDPSAIADTELVDCNNFDIDLDGSLKSRPPWIGLDGTRYGTGATGLRQMSSKALASFVFNGQRMVVWTATRNLGEGAVDVYLGYTWLDGPNTGQQVVVLTTTGTQGDFAAVVRYKDILYVYTTLGGGGTITAIGNTSATWTQKTYPPASAAVIYKERVFLMGDKLSNLSRMYFSDAGNPDSFPSANFFDIRPGDGDSLNEGVVYQDNLFLFKNNSIWVFAYDTQPAAAVLQQLHDDLGVDNQDSLALYENQIYFLKNNQVYMIANFDFTRVSTKIPFEYDTTVPATYAAQGWSAFNWIQPTFLCLVGDRLVVRYWNRLYVYHLRMRSWSRWSSQDPLIQYMGSIVRAEDVGRSDRRLPHDVFVAGTSLNIAPYQQQIINNGDEVFSLIQMQDTYDSSTQEGCTYPLAIAVAYKKDILCHILTKIYDVGISHRFKRLMHWGVDVVTGRSVTGTLSPYSLAYRVTWAQLHLYTWAQLQTWGYPLFAQPSTTQTAPVDAGVYRRYIRFPKGLRFRLLQFSVDMETVGNTTDGPARLYSLTAFVAVKQLVPKGVN